MDERCKAAFESARDTAKQLIVLSTGVLALTVTFAKDFLKNVAEDKMLVHAAWYVLLVSCAAGVWVLLAVTGTLGSRKRSSVSHTDVYEPNISAPAVIQVLTFGFGLLLAVIFGVRQ
jgi:hypothetical protein